MALDENSLNKFAELVSELAPEYAQNLSQLLNVDVAISFEGFVDPLVIDDKYNIATKAISVFSSVNDNQDGSVSYIADVNDAIVIADLMAGGSGDVAGKAFEAIEQAAFSESLAQSSIAISHKLKTLVAGKNFDLGDFDSAIIDPENPDSLAHSLVQSEYVTLCFGIQIADVVNSNVFLNLAEVFVSSVVEILNDPKNAGKNSVSEVDFAQMSHTINSDEIYEKKNLNLLMDIKLGLIVELGRAEMQLRDILKLTKGSVIELDRLSGEPVDLFVNNKIIARGEVVVIDDSFGLRITQLAGNMDLASDLGLSLSV
ncbi:MAG: flagellar motor switch protein FliN [Candidatus Caenarcaniphilales bacterium]|nr:flagellar motor switch protein FliN [Candidatus Caenarcaniphilales bacterium]